jgi:hypothetical protein
LAGKGRERLKTKDKRPKNEGEIEALSCGINSEEIPLQRKWVSERGGYEKKSTDFVFVSVMHYI